jgi:serine/threonine-protein kinase
MVGKTIGKYRFIEKLGRGAMGTVYKAVDETLDREVAIKILNPDLDDSDVIRRFRAEASILAKLNHPAIATIYELHRRDDDLLMVMEIVRGETLDELVQRSGPLEPERAAHLLAQVLEAIGHAHAAGVIHRDLKPSNVMVTETGAAKIMDFGIARVHGAEHMTTAGLMVGTPAYMSPEQVQCHDVDGRSDLYSVGVMFYRLLTGKLPFQADTAIGMVQKQISDMPTPARHHRAELPAWTLTILDRALAKSPVDRYQTAEEFRAALLEAIHATSLLASGALAAPKIAAHAPDPAGDTSIATALSPAAMRPTAVPPPTVAIPTLAPSVAPPQAAGPPRVELKPPAAAPRKNSFGVAALIALVTIGALVGGFAALRRSRAAKPATAESADAALSTPPQAPVAAAPASPIPESTPPPAPPAPPPVDTTAAPAVTAPPAAGAPTARPARAARGAKPPDPVPETPAPPVVEVPAPAPAPAPVAPPFVFAAKMLVKDGEKPRERDATVRLADGQVTVTAQDHAILSALPYDAVLSVIYSKAKQPLWDAPGGAIPIQRIDGGAFGFLKGGRHWVSLRTKERFVVLRVDEDQVARVLSAIEERTGKTTVRVAEPKGSQ